MRARIFLLVGGMLPALVAAPGGARAQLRPQLQTGSMIPVKPKPVDPKEAAVVRKRFAQCVYRTAPTKATALLNNSDAVSVDMAGANIKNINEELDMTRCLGDQAGIDVNELEYRFQLPILRDLLAEEAYLAHNRTAPALPPAPIPPVQVTFVSTGDKLPTAQSMTEFSDCAVRQDVVHADALLRTRPASDNERTAAQAMGPALGACLLQGQNVKLSPRSIRAFIAYAMWNRFTRAAR